MDLFVFLLTLSFASYICCQSACNTHKTCGACIGHAFETCVWCSENKNVTAFRCQPKSYKYTDTEWCKEEFVSSPTSDFLPKQDNPFSSNVQFRPQEIKIKASPGVDVTFNISYQPAKDFPLDVYFLMDYSFTMKKHREALQKQSIEIYNALTRLTGNVSLGVGSFVEKPGLPYSDVNVATVYAFKNHLSLTSDMGAFERMINESKFGSNYDDAEASLDALMQVMKCEKELGWRKETRRIIVLATDNTYHSAGDGKMLGAIKPNDMKCHLKDNEYKREDSLKYDYPSVSLINKVARDGNFLIIFAAQSHVKSAYEALTKQISGARYAELQEKSNIFEIIKDAYEESVSEVKIDYKPSPSFRITIDQDCKAKPKRNCDSTPLSRTVNIPVTIRSLECLKSEKPENIIIYPIGLNEKLKVMFKVDCQCECEKTSPGKTNTRKNCNNKGFIQCGACKCDKDWGGDSCEISCSDEASIVLEKKCFPTNSTRKCNGHGTCECGKCLCTDGFTGDVCEYDPHSCDTGKNGKICGGRDQGTCRFGKCSCEGDWTGKACDCPIEEKSLRKCTGPFSKKSWFHYVQILAIIFNFVICEIECTYTVLSIGQKFKWVCSGNGRCDCGTCICNKVDKSTETNDVFLGAFCEVCEKCEIERCKELEDYAKCNQNNGKAICDEKFNLTTEINLKVLVASKSELAKSEEWRTGTQCRSQLDDGTFLMFRYNTDKITTVYKDSADTTSKMLLMIQKEVDVPPKADMLVPIASAITGILLVGLLTVVFWKFLIEMYDKREYNKFCLEAKEQGYDVSENVLYQPPTQNFVNPGFNQNL